MAIKIQMNINSFGNGYNQKQQQAVNPVPSS